MCNIGRTKYYAVLYRELEHRRVLASVGGPGSNPPQILRDNCILPYLHYIVVNVFFM